MVFVTSSSTTTTPSTTSKDLSPNAAEFVISAPQHFALRLAAYHAAWYLFVALTHLRLPLSSVAPPLTTALELIVSDPKDTTTLEISLLSHLILEHIRRTFSTLVSELTTKKNQNLPSKSQQKKSNNPPAINTATSTNSNNNPISTTDIQTTSEYVSSFLPFSPSLSRKTR
jgi:hypothetical protein